MAIELTMPRLSDTMESGTIIKWNVKEGDAVSAGDVVADVETDKATMEMQVYDDGKVSRIVVPEGKTVAVGTLIAVIDDGSGDAAATAAPKATAAPASAPASTSASSRGVNRRTARFLSSSSSSVFMRKEFYQRLVL